MQELKKVRPKCRRKIFENSQRNSQKSKIKALETWENSLEARAIKPAHKYDVSYLTINIITAYLSIFVTNSL